MHYDTPNGGLTEGCNEVQRQLDRGCSRRTWGIRTIGTEGGLTVLYITPACLAKVLARKVNLYPGKKLSTEENK